MMESCARIGAQASAEREGGFPVQLMRPKQNATALPPWRGQKTLGRAVGLEAVAASAATVSAAATTTETAATATGTVFAGLGFIHGQGAALVILAVFRLDSLAGFRGGGHFDKGKTAGLAREFVHDQAAAGDRSVGTEQLAKIAFRGVKGQVADI
jgi:hypothetical protein